jgi:hypothetical protein
VDQEAAKPFGLPRITTFTHESISSALSSRRVTVSANAAREDVGDAEPDLDRMLGAPEARRVGSYTREVSNIEGSICATAWKS